MSEVQIGGEAHYLISLTHHHAPIITMRWPWYAMFPQVNAVSHTRYAQTLTKEEGDFLLAEQGPDQPRWSSLIKLWLRDNSPAVSMLQMEEVSSRKNGYAYNYVTTDAGESNE